MIGRTNASNKKSPNIEMVNISLLSNQLSHQDLIGTMIILSYEDYNEEILWEGIEITRNIPENTEYTITFGEADGYKTPSSVTYTAVKGLSRSVQAMYYSEFLTLNVTGTNTPVVTIKKAKDVSDETIATQTSVSGLHKIAYDTEYMIEASAVEGFTTPEVQYYTANQPSRNVSVDYLLAEKVTVNVSAEDGAIVNGVYLRVLTSEGTNNYFLSGNPISFLIVYGETYTVSVDPVVNYTTPEPQTYTASQPTREISMEYKKAVEHVVVNVSSNDYTDMDGYKVYVRPNVANGVYIQDVDGNLYTESEWNTMKVANGIAVVTDECSFVIALEDARENVQWSEYGNARSLTIAYGDEAALDFNGLGNTNNMISTASSTNNAAQYCRDYIFPNGQTGYLGAVGEWNAVAGSSDEIDELLSVIGAESLKAYSWTSTEYDEDGFVNVYYKSAKDFIGLSYQDTCNVRAFTELGSSYTITNGKVEFDVPPGVEYTISVEDIDGYTTPEPQSFVADVGTRTVDMVYEAGKLGVFIATQAGDLINPNNWTSSSGTAVGVAVCTENSKYIIGLSSQQVDTIRWATSTTTDKANVPTSTNESEIITYYDGESYTTAMGRSTSDASGLMDSQRITFGDEKLRGYLGSAGEWNDAINNYQAISAAFVKIGDSLFPSSSGVFWTSCEYSNSLAWNVLYDSYEGFEFENSYKTSYYAAVPFYKI